MIIRQHSVYSMVGESRHGFFSLVGGGKKIKNKNWSQFFFLVGNILDVLNRNSTEKGKKLANFWHVGGKNKKKFKMLIFFSRRA